MSFMNLLRFLRWCELTKGEECDWNNILDTNLIRNWLEEFRTKTQVKPCTLLKYMDAINVAVDYITTSNGMKTFTHMYYMLVFEYFNNRNDYSYCRELWHNPERGQGQRDFEEM